MPLFALRQDVQDFANAGAASPRGKAGLYLVNKLRRSEQDGTVAWFYRNLSGGLSPLVSPHQNSPIIGQGTYREIKAGAIVTRHVKRFTNDELTKLFSPDDRFRINAQRHLFMELADMERRIYETQEFVAWSALARGAVKYIDNESAPGRLSVNVSFPVDLSTETTLWDHTSGSPAAYDADIPTRMNALLKKFAWKYGKMPDAIRMTREVFDLVVANPLVQKVFTTWLMQVANLNQTAGMPSIPAYGTMGSGLIDPAFIAKGLNWPPIEIMENRTNMIYYCTNSEAEGAGITVEMVDTWGISVGDTLLCKYNLNDDTWDYEATVTTVNDGVSVVFTIPSGKTLSAGDCIVNKPTFFPADRIQLIADEAGTQFIGMPFYIDAQGNTITPNKHTGPFFDVFGSTNEPGIAAYARAWDEFGLAMDSKIMSVKVR